MVELIKEAYGHETDTRDSGRENSLNAYKKGRLRLSPKYPYSHKKLEEYLEFFEETKRTGSAYQQIKEHLHGDVLWDQIESMEDEGEKTCVDYTVDTHHNFILSGLITHNSTSLANFLLTEGISTPQFRSLFVSPSKEQTSRFSNTRFAKALFFSPMLKKYFVTRDMPANNVTMRMIANGSEFFFSYACDDAERIRGISCDRIVYDEVQSMMLEAIEPVIRECLGASKYKLRMYCGTPLSAENDIEIMLWQKSTQCQWVVPCKECGANNILGWKNIGSKYLICSRCEKGPLDVRLGRWYATALDPSIRIAGYRIPQIALHRNVGTPEAYEDILDKQKNYSKAKFNNEVLGISDSLGARLISLDMLRGLCKEWSFNELGPSDESMKGVTQVVAGVDWGGQSPTNVSRTALAIWGVKFDGRLRLLFGRIFPSGHAHQDIQDIVRICQTFRVGLLIGDSGEGMLSNAELRLSLGDHIAFGNRYGGMDGKIRWNNNQNAPGYHSDKTMLVDQFMQGVLAKRFEFPHWEQFKNFSDDIMAEYEETTQQGRRIWKHAATRPDDFLHAMVFGWLAAKVITGEVAMYMAKDRTIEDD
jgi:hypothetical protein